MQHIRLSSTVAALLLSTFATTDAGAQRNAAPEAAQPEQAQPATQTPVPRPEPPMAELLPLLERVERQTNKEFVVDRRLGTRIYLGSVEPNDVTYPVLLAILRTMGFAAVEIDGRVNIVPDAEVRAYPTPIVQSDDASIAADEFVTRIVTTINIEAPQLIPVLRPMMPQAAHLAAVMPNKILMTDRYANTKRITEIIRSLDVPQRN